MKYELSALFRSFLCMLASASRSSVQAVRGFSVCVCNEMSVCQSLGWRSQASVRVSRSESAEVSGRLRATKSSVHLPSSVANLHTLTEIKSKSKQAELFMTRRSVCSVGLVMICPLTSHRNSAINSPAERSPSEPSPVCRKHSLTFTSHYLH